jgi:hypothetical protein
LKRKIVRNLQQVGTITSQTSNQCLGEPSLQDDGLWAPGTAIQETTYSEWPLEATSLDLTLPSVNDARLESNFYSGGPGLFYFPSITPPLFMTQTANNTFHANTSFGTGSTMSTQDSLQQDFFESFEAGFNSPDIAAGSSDFNTSIGHSSEEPDRQSQHLKSLSSSHRRPQAKSFTCEFGCQNRFSSTRDVRRHILSMHRKKAEQLGLAHSSSMCPYCCRSYTREDNLTRHLRRSDCGSRQ